MGSEALSDRRYEGQRLGLPYRTIVLSTGEVAAAPAAPLSPVGLGRSGKSSRCGASSSFSSWAASTAIAAHSTTRQPREGGRPVGNSSRPRTGTSASAGVHGQASSHSDIDHLLDGLSQLIETSRSGH